MDGQGQPADAFLRIAHLTKRFGQFTALSDVSLDIHEGEFVCFLGPSGCGKTTLLRAIAGLDIQTSGSVVQAGADISALPPAERDFGIVFQSYALFPNMTVSSNVAYGLQSRRQSRAEIAARVAELLELVGMPEQGDKYPAQLSGGQQQRVALARAIATSPGLLLLDEPLSALDARVRVYLRREVRELQRRLGVTTVMVTHDQEEALTMADRIVVMNEGKIEQVGTPIEVYREPATSFVAAFIGTMNFVAGEVRAPGQVALGGIACRCPTEGFAPGQSVTAAVRPEDIQVAALDGAPPQASAVRVAATEFMGSFVRAVLVPTDAEAPRLTADLSVNLVRGMEIAVGDVLAMVLPSDGIRLYPGTVGGD